MSTQKDVHDASQNGNSRVHEEHARENGQHMTGSRRIPLLRWASEQHNNRCVLTFMLSMLSTFVRMNRFFSLLLLGERW